jgi:hypothetical protein
MGKTPEEVLEIDADTIQRSIGGLPTDNMHCATLAVATLQEAINDYMNKSTSDSSAPSRFSQVNHFNLHRRLQQRLLLSKDHKSNIRNQGSEDYPR